MTLFFYYPKGFGISLPAVYAIWLLVIAMLYPLCRWVAGVKARRRDWWLSYVVSGRPEDQRSRIARRQGHEEHEVPVKVFVLLRAFVAPSHIRSDTTGRCVPPSAEQSP